LKEGYKQTEVGVIPVEWQVCGITDICSNIFLGLTTKVDYVKRNGVPLVRAKDINTGRLLFDETLQISKKQHQELTKYLRANKGDILVSKSGTLGICALVDTDEEFSIYESIIVMKRNTATCDSRFLLWLMRLEATQDRLLKETVGSTVGHLNLLNFRKLVVPIPEIEEQKAIVAALSDVDALISALDRLIAKKRDIKQAAMQELLTGKRRLPEFIGEWEIAEFGELTSPRKERIDPRLGGKPSLCIELEHIAPETGRLIGGTITNELSSLKSVFYPEDVLFGKLRAYLRKYWIADRRGVCSTEIWVLSPSARIMSEYLFQIVRTDQFIEAASTAYGTHMPRSDWNVVRHHKIPLPLPEEQSAIASILSDMDNEIAALETRREKTSALKHGMMQELLTGRIRLV